MAKNLTDLTARTATANTDLMHINSGGTDYKQTKADFLSGAFQKAFTSTDTLTSQVDDISYSTAWTLFGTIPGYQHQTETGLPVNANCFVRVSTYTSSYRVVEIWSINNPQEQHWIINKNNGTWGEWQHVPARSEIDSIFKRIVFFNFNLTSGGTAKHSLADHVPYGNQTGVVFLQPRGFTVNNISKIYMFRFNQAKTACYFTDVTSGVTSSLSARLDSDGNFYNTSTEYSITYDCALFLLYY